MQFDLNRFSHDANSPVPMPRLASSVPDIAVGSFVVTQELSRIIYRADRIPEPLRERTKTLSNQPNVFVVHQHGNDRKGVRISSLSLEHDILLNTSLDSHLKVPAPEQPSVQVSPSAPRGPWDIIEGLIGTIDGPPDWSSQHDHYLYGTPKR